MGDLGAKAESVIVAQFVRLGVAERVRRLSALYEEIIAPELMAAEAAAVAVEKAESEVKDVSQDVDKDAQTADSSPQNESDFEVSVSDFEIR